MQEGFHLAADGYSDHKPGPRPDRSRDCHAQRESDVADSEDAGRDRDRYSEAR